MTHSKLRIFLAALAVALVTVTPAVSAPATPSPLFPSGDTFDGVPAMGWDKVSGADHYEVQVGADPGFNPQLFLVSTKNTRATLTKALVSGTYWWRVHAVDASGDVSPWSAAQSFVIDWSTPPTLTAPADGAAVSFPDTPLTLKWAAVPRAQKYKLQVTSDPTLSTPVSTNYPLQTQAQEFTVPEALAAGTYYWAVTPIDAQGNLGARSAVRSFVWAWPHQPENPQVADLDPDPDDQHFDPQFSWDPVPGAASYDLEVTSADASGSVVFSGSTIATTFAPNEIFQDNVYDWRVRAVDAGGNRGAWTEGLEFERAFDKNNPGIQNLRLTDYVTGNAAVDQDSGTPGFQTQVPVVTWDPVPGASSYQVQVAPFTTSCNFNDVLWDDMTATTAWAPLGKTFVDEPFPSPGSVGVSTSSRELIPGASYCVRVRARSGHKGSIDVRGGFTFLDDGTGAAFTWTGYPSTSACSPSCFNGYLGSDDYLLPARASTVTNMPFLTWEPLDGAQSYWVIVAKDANFSTIVDYAFTRFPAYTPRRGSNVRTYADELTSYYWAVLPSPETDGDFAAFDPLKAAASTFEKQSDPPTATAPAADATVDDQPVFEWTTAEGAKQYHIQIATDQHFSASDILKDTTTASTSYSAETTYPADTVLWWRVQAQDEEGRGLTWSTPRSFEKALAAPVPDPGNPTAGDLIPTFSWEPVQGASSYDVHFQLPDGSSSKDATGYTTSAVTAIKMTGAGHFLWQVRANYPGNVHGPYTPLMDFTRTIHEPANPVSAAGSSALLLSWDPKNTAKQYKVQIAKNTSFSPSVETATTDNTNFAPTMGSSNYTSGGTFYWRVAAIDGDGNQGDWTAIKTFDLAPIAGGPGSGPSAFKLTSKGSLVRKRTTKVTVTVKNATSLNVVAGATVKATGAGVSATKLTSTSGVATFSLKPTKLGQVTFRVTKSGYTAASLVRNVRAP
ncbi:MAG TPA: Ig-like domain-containing protein [Gaiellaceae bacterium]